MYDFIKTIFYEFQLAIPFGVISLVIGVVILAILNWNCRRNGKNLFKWQAAAILLLLCYLGGLAAITFMNRMDGMRIGLQLYPLLAFREAWNSFTLQTWLNPLLNIAMFIPLGVLLPLAAKFFRRCFWTLMMGTCISLGIELLQYILGRGQADVTDSATLKQQEYDTAFSHVLFGTDTLIQVYPELDSEMTLAEIYKVNDEMEMKEENRTFALLDLDDDGTPELILPLALGDADSTYGFEILHYTDGDVLGYLLPYRGLHSLKEDGTFIASGGARDWKICSISEFSRQTYRVNVHLQIQTSGSVGTNTTVSYYADGHEVDEQSFNDAVREWDQKDDVTFLKLSKKYWE